MEITSAQQLLLRHIKSKLPQHISLADELADVIGISPDSVYRRIRGETQLTLSEAAVLCTRYNISIDQLLQHHSNSFLFTGSLINNSDFNYDRWLETVLSVISNVKTYNPCHMWYLAKEFPFFYYFLIPEIAAFKSFFFMRSILFYDEWKWKKFSTKDDYSRYHSVWQKLADTFSSIPGTEIWTIENITSTIRQVEFYHSIDAFQSDDDVECLFNKLLEMITHVELQAEYGVKLRFGQKPSSNVAIDYHLYINELIMGDNLEIFQMGGQYVAYLNHTVLNFLTTSNERFNQYMKHAMDLMVQKSIPISTTNVKERMRFFNRLRSRIEEARKNILKK